MTKNSFYSRAITLLACLCFLLLAGFATAKPVLWEATKGEQKIYLFGSVHLGKAEMYPLPTEVIQGLESSDGLVVEVDLSQVDMLKVGLLIQQLGFDKTPITQRLSQETKKQYQHACKSKNLRCGLYTFYQPWLLATDLAVTQMTAQGYEEKYGVDKNLIAKARALKKPVLSLESMEEQLKIMAALTPAQQEQMLLDALNLPDAEVHQLFDVWKSGDVKALTKLMGKMKSTEAGRGTYQRLIIERNQTMASRLLTLMQSHKTLFVVIGAGHLVGEQSVVDKLEQAGFAIKIH